LLAILSHYSKEIHPAPYSSSQNKSTSKAGSTCVKAIACLTELAFHVPRADFLACSSVFSSADTRNAMIHISTGDLRIAIPREVWSMVLGFLTLPSMIILRSVSSECLELIRQSLRSFDRKEGSWQTDEMLAFPNLTAV
jgi:hypothetical protein